MNKVSTRPVLGVPKKRVASKRGGGGVALGGLEEVREWEEERRGRER